MHADERASRSGGLPDGAPPLAILSDGVVYREQGGASFTVNKARARDQRGNEFNLHYASVKDGAGGAVCIVECGDKLLFGRHWRVTTGAWGCEFPRGMGEPGERAEQTAQRELREEAGIEAPLDLFKVLQHIHADTGMLKDDISVVHLAMLNTKVNPMGNEDDWELADLTWCSESQIDEMIRSGEITDGITLAALAIWRADKHCSRGDGRCASVE